MLSACIVSPVTSFLTRFHPESNGQTERMNRKLETGHFTACHQRIQHHGPDFSFGLSVLTISCLVHKLAYLLFSMFVATSLCCFLWSNTRSHRADVSGIVLLQCPSFSLHFPLGSFVAQHPLCEHVMCWNITVIPHCEGMSRCACSCSYAMCDKYYSSSYFAAHNG